MVLSVSKFRSQFGRIHSRGDRSGSWSTDINRGFDPRGENPIGVEHATGSARTHGRSRDPQGGNCDERAATHESFRGDLCDSGAGQEGVQVSGFTESF